MTEWNAEIAEWYADNYGEYPTNRLAIDALGLPMDAVVLDIGCGTGAALRHAAPSVTQGRLIGVDPVPRMIEIANQRTFDRPQSERIEYRLGSAEKLPVEDDVADVVLAFDSLDHWQDTQVGFREVHRVLRKGGRFAIVKDGHAPGEGKARREMTEMLARAGFEVLEQRQVRDDEISLVLWVCVEPEASASELVGSR